MSRVLAADRSGKWFRGNIARMHDLSRGDADHHESI